MTMIARFAAAALALAVVAGPSAAQDFNQPPTYGVINLSSNFTPDPQVVNLQSGGSIDASGLGAGCGGFIANAPDVRLNYTSGSLPLVIGVHANADTTIVVNAPDGSWHCDDDGGQHGLNPALSFARPQSGQYDIWVGTYGNASLQPAQLYITEIPANSP